MSDQPVAPSARDTSSKTSKAWRADASEPPKTAGTSRRNSPPSWSAATTGPARVTPSSLAEACPSSSGASSRATSSGPGRSMQRSGSTETPGPARALGAGPTVEVMLVSKYYFTPSGNPAGSGATATIGAGPGRPAGPATGLGGGGPGRLPERRRFSSGGHHRAPGPGRERDRGLLRLVGH